MPIISVILVIMIALALVTNFIGVHTVLGAFAAGIMIGQSPILTKHIGLTIGVLDKQLFTVIVLMAVVTTVCMPPLLRWALARVPMRDEEKARLEREAAEEKDSMPKLERVLVQSRRPPAIMRRSDWSSRERPSCILKANSCYWKKAILGGAERLTAHLQGYRNIYCS
jgi:hypothetical protein